PATFSAKTLAIGLLAQTPAIAALEPTSGRAGESSHHHQASSMTQTRGTPQRRPKSYGMGTPWTLSVLHPQGKDSRSDRQKVPGPWTGCHRRRYSRCGQTPGAGDGAG